LFLVVVFTVLALMHAYVWQRMVRDTTRRGRARLALTIGLIALAAMLIAAMLLSADGPRWLAWPGFLWLAVIFYLVLALLVAEPVRLLARLRRRAPESAPAPRLDRRLFLARATAVAAGAVSVGLVGSGVPAALGPPRLLRVPIGLRRLDEAFTGFRIAVVSDIHLGPLAGRAHTERIVRMINETEPDLIAIVGDLVDGTVERLGAAAAPLRDLHSREGAFFVTGNHEYYAGGTVDWLHELDRLGVHPLRNESTLLRRGGATVLLAGVNDRAGGRRDDPPDFDRALARMEPARPTVLLAHQPVQVHEAAARGVDLQLSGHTHGGQVWPFHYLVRLSEPALAGLSRVADTQLYVTRGAGFWGPPVRVGAPPDITVVTLQPGG